jgi:hypothetical protein
MGGIDDDQLIPQRRLKAKKKKVRKIVLQEEGTF